MYDLLWLWPIPFAILCLAAVQALRRHWQNADRSLGGWTRLAIAAGKTQARVNATPSGNAAPGKADRGTQASTRKRRR